MLSPMIAGVANAATDEILVTATRRATSVQDIPYNISAVSGSDIEGSQMLDTSELLRSIPGVTVMERGARNQGTVNTIMIRGVNVESGALGDYAVNTVPTVSSYIDETPIFANMMIKDLERVEVLRGPQGTLYGSGSLGGTLRYITRDPVLGEFSGNASATFRKTRDSEDVGNSQDLVVNVPLGEKAALRFVANRTDLPGIIDYTNVYELDGSGIPVAPSGILSDDATFRSVEDADTIEQWFGRAKLRIEPTENVDITLSHARQSDEAGGRRAPSLGENGAGTPYGADEHGSIQLEPSSRDVDMTSLEINVDLGFATLTSSTSKYNHDGESVSDNTGFYVNVGWMSAFYYNYPRPMASAYRTYEDEALIQEIRLVSNSEGPLNYVIGGYYQDQDRSSTQMSFLPGFNAYVDADWGWDVAWVTGDQDWNYSSDESYEELSIFGELSYDISDDVTITGGLRWFDNEMTISTYNHLPLWTGLYAPNTAVTEISDDDVLFKGNIAWDVNEDMMVYATISEGYRHGGTNGVPQNEAPGYDFYESDSVINYEIGLKGSGENFQYTAAVFMIDWSDIQLNTSTPWWGFFAAVNGDEAQSKGFEFSIDGNLSDNFSYTAGYNYVKAELTADFENPSGSLVAPDGTTLPGTPEHQFNIGGAYTSDMANDVSVTYRVDGYYQSETRNVMSTSHAQTADIDGFSIWNASATVNFDNWNVALWVKNLSDDDGITGLYTLDYMGNNLGATPNFFGNSSKAQIALPRTFGITVNYQF